jgi:hypothetical protein
MTDTWTPPPAPPPAPEPPRGQWVWHLENYLAFTPKCGRSNKLVTELDGTWPQLSTAMRQRGIPIGPEPDVYGFTVRTVRKPPSEHHNPNVAYGVIELSPSRQDQLI